MISIPVRNTERTRRDLELREVECHQEVSGSQDGSKRCHKKGLLEQVPTLHPSQLM